MTPLDDLRSYWKDESLGLLKDDVEGFEEHVFRGPRRCFDKIGPSW